jgi:hypothetical protein
MSRLAELYSGDSRTSLLQQHQHNETPPREASFTTPKAEASLSTPKRSPALFKLQTKYFKLISWIIQH